MICRQIALATLALMFGVGIVYSGASVARAQDRADWARVPQAYRGLEHQGYHDGIEGARKDFGNHRQPDVNNREEYRHPELPREQWGAYQQGFRRGYAQAASHLWGGGQEPISGGPDMPMGDRGLEQGLANSTWQQGFQLGVEGALKDFSNHRAPNPTNRDEFRHPDIPYELRGIYRDGFQRGYQSAANALMSGEQSRWIGPGGEARMRGFQDGMEGAMRDYGNHRIPDPNNRDEYRHPDVPYSLQSTYQEGFRRGYSVAMSQLTGN